MKNSNYYKNILQSHNSNVNAFTYLRLNIILNYNNFTSSIHIYSLIKVKRYYNNNVPIKIK